MDPHAMRRPAKLLIWRTGLDSTGLHEACTYPTLAEAIAAAAAFLGNDDTYPWIVTEDGEILTPQWIATYLDANPDAKPEPPPRVPTRGERPTSGPSRERGWLWFLRRQPARPAPYRLAFAR